MDEKVYDELGSLLLFNKATDEDLDLLIQLLARGRYEYVTLLREIIKDNQALVELFDVLAGQKVQFPERRKIYKTLEKVFIYNYCKNNNFSENSYIFMSKQYGKRVPQVKAIVETMNKFLDSNTNKEFEQSEREESKL